MSTIDPPDLATFGLATVELRQSPVLTARIGGEIDMANAELIGRYIADACRSHLDRLDIDMSPATYVDSAGIAMLVDLANRVDAMRTPMIVIAPPGSAAHRVIELTGLSRRLHRVDIAPPL